MSKPERVTKILYLTGHHRQVPTRRGSKKQSLPRKEETGTGNLWPEEGSRRSRAHHPKIRTGQGNQRPPNQKPQRRNCPPG